MFLFGTSAISFEVHSSETRCFTEFFESGLLVAGDYRVNHKSASMQLNIQFVGPDGSVVFSKMGAVEGKFAFTASSSADGVHQLCFVSVPQDGSSQQPSMVQLAVRVGAMANDYADVAKKEHLKPLEVELLRLKDMIAAVTAENAFLQKREDMHRDVNESTNAKAAWMSVLNVVILVASSIFQVVHLKRYFTAKKWID